MSAAATNDTTTTGPIVCDAALAARDAAARRARPSAEFNTQKRRLARLDAKRPAWVSPPANDNQAWPLAQQLRKEGNDVLLRVAERYRAIYDAATSDVQLVGTSLAWDDTYSLDRDARVKGDGSVEFKGARRLRLASERKRADEGRAGAGTADERKKPVTFRPRNPQKPRGAWNGDAALNAAIDGRRLLQVLQSTLGPLLDTFEDAVLHGESLSSIGAAKGGNTVSSGPIGRAYVMDGLAIVQRELSKADREPVA